MFRTLPALVALILCSCTDFDPKVEISVASDYIKTELRGLDAFVVLDNKTIGQAEWGEKYLTYTFDVSTRQERDRCLIVFKDSSGNVVYSGKALDSRALLLGAKISVASDYIKTELRGLDAFVVLDNKTIGQAEWGEKYLTYTFDVSTRQERDRCLIVFKDSSGNVVYSGKALDQGALRSYIRP